MKILLEIKENKADFMMELLNNFPFVKAKKISKKKGNLLDDLDEAVQQVALHKQGKAKLKTAQQVLDEL